MSNFAMKKQAILLQSMQIYSILKLVKLKSKFKLKNFMKSNFMGEMDTLFQVYISLFFSNFIFFITSVIQNN